MKESDRMVLYVCIVCNVLHFFFLLLAIIYGETKSKNEIILQFLGGT